MKDITISEELKKQMDLAISETGYNLTYQQFIEFLLKKNDVSVTVGITTKTKLNKISGELGMDNKELIEYLLNMKDYYTKEKPISRHTY